MDWSGRAVCHTGSRGMVPESGNCFSGISTFRVLLHGLFLLVSMVLFICHWILCVSLGKRKRNVELFIKENLCAAWVAGKIFTDPLHGASTDSRCRTFGYLFHFIGKYTVIWENISISRKQRMISACRCDKMSRAETVACKDFAEKTERVKRQWD